MDKTITIFAKNAYRDIHVSLREYKGIQLIDVREFMKIQGSDEMVPTCKGVAISIHLLPDLIKALNEVEKLF
ncbi:MAG: transcriptional coactivator p15/PC4 family protein [Promethearchaeota archaeon]